MLLCWIRTSRFPALDATTSVCRFSAAVTIMVRLHRFGIFKIHQELAELELPKTSTQFLSSKFNTQKTVHTFCLESNQPTLGGQNSANSWWILKIPKRGDRGITGDSFAPNWPKFGWKIKVWWPKNSKSRNVKFFLSSGSHNLAKSSWIFKSPKQGDQGNAGLSADMQKSSIG